MNNDKLEDIIKAQVSPLVARQTELETQLGDQAKDLDKLRRTRLSAGRPVDQRGLSQVLEDHIASSDPHKGFGLAFGKYVRCLVLGERNKLSPAQAAESILKDADFAHEITKALGESTIAGGGALVPTMYAADLIAFLRPTAIVRRAGPIVIPLPRGNLTMPKQTSASTAAYEGENTATLPSSQTFGQAKLNAKKLAALTVISNDLLRDSNPAVDILVRNDLGLSVSLREDLAFLRGAGTGYEPLGILNAINGANKINATQAGSSATITEVTNNLFELQGTLEDNNVPLNRACWFMHPRSKRYLMTLRDGVGHYVFQGEMLKGTLLGYPFYCSTQIPVNLGGSGIGSEVYFGSMDQFLIGDNLDMELLVVPNGAWDNGSGVITSGISNDQTVVRCISKHDSMLRHDFGFGVLSNVTWIA